MSLGGCFELLLEALGKMFMPRVTPILKNDENATSMYMLLGFHFETFSIPFCHFVLFGGRTQTQRIAITVAVIPPDDVLEAHGIDTKIFRVPRYRHCPPKLFLWSLEDVSARLVLLGSESMPIASPPPNMFDMVGSLNL